MVSLSAARRSGPSWPQVFGVLLVTAYAAVTLYGVGRWSYDIWGALIIGPILVAASLPVLAMLTRHDAETDPWLPRLLVTALVVKLLAAVPRWAVAFVLYGGTADASHYHHAGANLALSYRDLILASPPGQIPGTGFIEMVTGIVYAVTGPSLLGGYLLFSWMGFWGLYFLYRAAVIAVPGLHRRRYAALVFFLPSMLFWPSGIGKEAWMTLGIGLTAYGAARMFTRVKGGFVLLAIGLLATLGVRPHITAILFVAVFAGYLLRPNTGASLLGPVAKGVGIAVLVLAGLLVVQQAKDFFGVDSVDSKSVNQVLDNTEVQTTQGGSSFHAKSATSPADVPKAALTVLFRPFPWEAHNLQARLAGLEGLFLIAVVAGSLPRLRTGLRRLRDPMVAMAVVYTAEFVYAFSRFGNFGIITRERVQVLPFVLLLLCLPKPARPDVPTLRGRR